MYYMRRGGVLDSDDDWYDEHYQYGYADDEDERKGDIQVIAPVILPPTSKFFSYLGDVDGIGWHRDFDYDFLFNTPSVTQNMRNI